MSSATEIVQSIESGGTTGHWFRPVPVATVLSALVLVRLRFLLSLAHENLLGFIPDDAFYELQIARHFLATGIWSFDRGFTTTTGFHLLNVYLMAMFPSLFNRPWLAIAVWLTVAALVAVAGIIVICKFAFQQFGCAGLFAAILVTTSYTFAQQSLSLLEFPYVVLIAACYAVATFNDSKPGRGLGLIFALGFGGSLARSDFGGLPAAVALICLGEYAIIGQSRRLWQSIWGLGGAAAGLLLVFLHNYFFSGHFLQCSAQVKALAAARAGYSLKPSLGVALSTVGLSSRPLLLLATVLVMGFALLFMYVAGRAGRIGRGGPYRLTETDFVVGATGLLAILIYSLVYALDGAVQPWYASAFAVPSVLVLGVACKIASRNVALKYFGAAAIGCLAIVNTAWSYRAKWPYQANGLRMVKHLRSHPVSGRLGGWNVGIPGYLLDGRVVNLDGLMNDQIYPFIRDRKVSDYITESRIRFLLDYRDDALGNPDIAVHLRPLYAVPSSYPLEGWNHYMLFEWDPAPSTRATKPE